MPLTNPENIDDRIWETSEEASASAIKSMGVYPVRVRIDEVEPGGFVKITAKGQSFTKSYPVVASAFPPQAGTNVWALRIAGGFIVFPPNWSPAMEDLSEKLDKSGGDVTGLLRLLMDSPHLELQREDNELTSDVVWRNSGGKYTAMLGMRPRDASDGMWFALRAGNIDVDAQPFELPYVFQVDANGRLHFNLLPELDGFGSIATRSWVNGQSYINSSQGDNRYYLDNGPQGVIASGDWVDFNHTKGVEPIVHTQVFTGNYWTNGARFNVWGENINAGTARIINLGSSNRVCRASVQRRP